jgi:hypothetical protein
MLSWSHGTFACSNVGSLRRWLANFPTECRRSITSLIIGVNVASIGYLSIPEKRNPLWIKRGELGFQDFPALRVLRRQSVISSSFYERLREQSEASEVKRSRTDVLVTFSTCL